MDTGQLSTFDQGCATIPQSRESLVPPPQGHVTMSDQPFQCDRGTCYLEGKHWLIEEVRLEISKPIRPTYYHRRAVLIEDYVAECDVPVPGIPGTGNFSFFWWYR